MARKTAEHTNHVTKALHGVLNETATGVEVRSVINRSQADAKERGAAMAGEMLAAIAAASMRHAKTKTVWIEPNHSSRSRAASDVGPRATSRATLVIRACNRSGTIRCR